MAAGSWPFSTTFAFRGRATGGTGSGFLQKKATNDAGSEPFVNFFFGAGSGSTVYPSAVGASAAIPAPTQAGPDTIEVLTEVPILSDADDATYSAGYSDSQAWHWVGRTTSAGTSPYNTYRFKIPTTVDASKITNVVLRLTGNSAGSAQAIIRVNPAAAAAPSSSGAERPDTKYAALGSTGEIPWAFTVGVGAPTDSPDLSVPVIAALAAIDETEYVGIHIGPDNPSTTIRNQMVSQDGTTPGHRPLLVITELVSANNSPSVSPVTSTSSISTPDISSSYTISYTNGTSLDVHKDNTATGSRTATLYLPAGSSSSYGHSDGFPVAVWTHGGFFTDGSRGELPRALREGLLSRGVAVLTPDYRLTEAILDGFEVLADGNEASFPLGIHDLKVAIRDLTLDKAGANLYDIDTQQVLLTGHSAGTSISSFVAFTKGDTATYSGMYPGSWPSAATFPPETYRWYRPAHVNRSNTSSYPFDFHQNGDTVSGVTLDDFEVIGLFLFAPAISLQNGVDGALTPDSDARFFISLGRRYYVSRDGTGSIDTTVYGEMDVDKYLDPATGTPTINEPYLGKSPVVPDFPIGVVWGTEDILTTKEAHYDAFVTALTNVGYIGSAPTEGVTNASGLSYYEVTADHEGTKSNSDGIANFFDWYDAISVSVSGGTATPTVVASTSTVPTPGWGSSRASLVVSVTSTVPAAVWGAGVAPTVVTATTTIPAAGWRANPTVVAVVATAATGVPSWGAGWVPTPPVAAVIGIDAQGGVGGGYTTPAALLAASAIPTPTRGSGWRPTSVTSTTAIPAPSALGGGVAQVAAVAGAASLTAPARGAGWVTTVVTSTTSIPAASFAAGGTISASAVTATTSIPSSSWGAVWLVTGPSATTAIAAQAGQGGGYTTPTPVAPTTAVPSPSWGATWVVAQTQATTTVGSPNFAGGMTVSAATVGSTVAVLGPSWGATWRPVVVTSVTSIGAAGWGCIQSVSRVASTTSTLSALWGAGWRLTGPSGIVGISAQGGVSGGLTTPNTTSGASGIPTPAWGAGRRLSDTSALAQVPGPSWSSGVAVAPLAVLAEIESAAWGAGWVQETVPAPASMPSPGWGSGIEVLMAVMATVLIRSATTTRLGQKFSYFDGVSQYECEATYYNRYGESQVVLEWIE